MSPWAEIKVSAGLYYPSRGSAGRFVSLPFQLLEASHIPWLMAPILHLQSQKPQVECFLHHITLTYYPSATLFHFKGPLELHWVHWIIQVNLILGLVH